MLGFYPLGAAPFADDGAINAANVDRLYPAAIVAGQPVLGTSDLVQVHSLGAGAITAGAVTLGTVTLVSVYNLTAAGVIVGSPTLGSPAIAQTHALSSTAVEATITISTPQLRQGHVLGTVDVSATVTVGDSQIAQTHVLAPMGVTAGAAVVTTAQIGQRHALLSTTLTGAAVAFLPPGPRLRNRWALTAATLVAGQPVLQPVGLVEFYAARRRHVSVNLSDDIQPVRDLLTEVDVVASANTVVIEVDGTTLEVYDGANIVAADNANSATGAYVGQTKAG